MYSFFHYSIEVALSLCVLCTIYYLLRKHIGSFQWKRAILVLSVLLSLLYPLLTIASIEPSNEFNDFAYEELAQVQYSLSPDSLEVMQNQTKEDAWLFLIPTIYFAGLSLFFIRLAAHLLSIFNIRKTAIRQDGYFASSTTTTPFTFLRSIFVNPKELSNQNLKLVLTHETVHKNQLHGLDLLFMEIVKLVFWFNPLLYWVKKELIKQHEYEADAQVVAAGFDPLQYQKLILEAAFSSPVPQLTNAFNNSLTKHRIIMLNKKPVNRKKSRLVALSFVPLLFAPALFISVDYPLANTVDNIKILPVKVQNDPPNLSPLKTTEKVKTTSKFGKRTHPITKEEVFHKGIDLAAPHGTPVVATANGTIDYAKNEEKRGNYVIIKHDATYTTTYSHMQSFIVEKGEFVKKGEVIGYVGSSGASLGPHLHYEVWKNGNKVDPQEYLPSK